MKQQTADRAQIITVGQPLSDGGAFVTTVLLASITDKSGQNDGTVHEKKCYKAGILVDGLLLLHRETVKLI